jgi:hypothetical protein
MIPPAQKPIVFTSGDPVIARATPMARRTRSA